MKTLWKKAAKKGHAKSAYDLAEHYRMNYEPTEMLRYYKMAADLGHIDASYFMGSFWETQKYHDLRNLQDSKFVAVCDNKIITYYQRAADQNHADACFSLAEFYERNHQKELVLKYYHAAAYQNHTQALQKLGQYYDSNGDYHRMFEYYALSMKNNTEIIWKISEFVREHSDLVFELLVELLEKMIDIAK